MQHTLTRIGDSLVFVIPKDIQERWNVLPETPLEVMADGDSLINGNAGSRPSLQ